MVCTSIGLTLKGVPVIGVIYNPFMDQLVSLLSYLSSDMVPSPQQDFLRPGPVSCTDSTVLCR